MLFKKLFRLLVVTGAVGGSAVATGCAARAAEQKQASPDAGTPADAGAKAQDQGGGSQGW